MHVDDIIKTTIILGAAIVVLGGATAPVSAALLVEEQFNYEGVDQSLNGQSGGKGFDGDWIVTGWGQGFQTGRTEFGWGTGTTQNAEGGLDFPDLITVGSALTRFGSFGQQNARRTLSESARAQLTADNSTIWFSILLGAEIWHRNASFIFGTEDFDADGAATGGRLNSSGQAFGVTLRTEHDENPESWSSGTGSPNAIAFVDSIGAIVDESEFIPPIQDGGTHHDTMLVVGKINWNPLGTEDELFIFNVTDPRMSEPDEADAIAYLSADFDQADFNIIALHDSGATIIDEIRMGTSFDSVTITEPLPTFMMYLE